MSGAVLQRALGHPGPRVVGVDPAVTEVADEQVATERAEPRRRDRHAPGRVQRAMLDHAPEQYASRRELVDEAVADACDIVMPHSVLRRIADVDLSAQRCNAERRVTGWEPVVDERALRVQPL